jgi:hypothetical protein
MPYLRVREQVLKKVECGGIEPLQIVEEQRKRMFRACEHVDEATEDELEPILRLLRRKMRNRRLRADYDLQFRDEIDNERSAGIQCLAKLLAPTLELDLAFTQQSADEASKGLRQGGVGDVALVLVEFARGKKAARWLNQYFVKFVDDRRLSDPGISRNEDQFRRATGYYAIESGKQSLALGCPSIQFLRDQQPVRRVVLAERKIVNAAP